MPRQLAVTVDTEEDGLWGGRFPVRNNSTENLRGLPRFQSVCEELTVPPTYLIDAPVLEDLTAIRRLCAWQNNGVCEVGTHCHPWCNPPIISSLPSVEESYLSNLPSEVQRAKLQWLTEGIANAMGKTPTAYRAGRYGFNESTAAILQELGYQVDSSILPLYDYRPHGGPNFLLSQRTPSLYFGTEDGRTLVEIPITAGFTRSRFEMRRRTWMLVRSHPWKQLRLAGVADRIGMAKRVKLSPEGTRLPELVQLVNACVKDGMSILVLMLHSSSLVPGYSPYVPNADRLEQLYYRLTNVVRHAIERHGFQPVTLTQAAQCQPLSLVSASR